MSEGKMKEEFAVELSRIQRDLKAPKNQYNSFGKYNYRSCEDILEGLKSVLKTPMFVTLSDDIAIVGDRVYVKSTATITDGVNSHSATGFAREPLNKKGMDESQITGAASSYARKYALNGLFLIDDTKDADSMDNSQPVQSQGNQQSDDKPWYNQSNFDVDKQNMLSACVNDGMLPQAIIKQLRQSYKVGKEMASKIEAVLNGELNQ